MVSRVIVLALKSILAPLIALDLSYRPSSVLALELSQYLWLEGKAQNVSGLMCHAGTEAHDQKRALRIQSHIRGRTPKYLE